MDGVVAAVFDAGLNREVTADRALLPQINCSVVHERQLHRHAIIYGVSAVVLSVRARKAKSAARRLVGAAA